MAQQAPRPQQRTEQHRVPYRHPSLQPCMTRVLVYWPYMPVYCNADGGCPLCSYRRTTGKFQYMRFLVPKQ